MATPSAVASSGFARQFKALTGNPPFPWQEKLFDLFVSNTIPPNINLPTGMGKTSIMPIWVLALTHQASENPKAFRLPRRLVWVVNRRVVVDQASNEIATLRARLNDAANTELEFVRDALKRMSAIKNPKGASDLLGISTLRGQFADNAEWRNDPARPAVIVGTVDMIGSRLLFSGYGVGFRAKPLHAGFLAQDSLLVHDEAHLEPAFQKLITDVRGEQDRCNEFNRLRVIELSATSRSGGDVFGLTNREKSPPDKIPDPPREPIHFIWRRLTAQKSIHLHETTDEEKLADQISALALERFNESGSAVLIFARRVEDVETIAKKIAGAKQHVEILTGTMRGFERDRWLRREIPQRFLPESDRDKEVAAGKGTVYLVCTSAGEVGINLSADHLVCDLSTFESMVQRFGRVNRFGDHKDTEIHILYPAEFEEKNELDQRRKKTLALIEQLNGNATPKALSQLQVEDCLAAFSPEPTILRSSDILFDSWSLTTIRGKLPGRPLVEPYLHGSSAELPETQVAWRDEVGIARSLLQEYKPEDLLDDYPLKPHELLHDRSGRVWKHLVKLAQRQPEAVVWLFNEDDSGVDVCTADELTRKDNRERIHYCTVVLPPALGGLRNGLLDGTSDTANDVADEWRDEHGRARRVRLWDSDPDPIEKTTGLRLIRTINIYADGKEEEETETRRWHWYELPKSAETDGSKNGFASVEWHVHTNDVVDNVTHIVRRLQLPDDFRDALIVAAQFHDLGKKRPLFQRILGNTTKILLAKSGKKAQPHRVNDNYRHEFGSLLDIQSEADFQKLSPDMKDLVLHLIAAHHGRGRPHFPLDEAFDPEPKGLDMVLIAAQVPQRFARLQRKYGRWGLAYLESLLRAADYAASANPSAVVENDQ